MINTSDIYFDHIFFDLDGTLSNPYVGISLSVLHACSELKLPTPNEVQLRQFIGPPIQDSFKALIGTTDDVLVREAVRVYRERFTVKGWLENQIFSGTETLLQELADLGKHLAVVTSKPQGSAEKILAHFNLRKFFGGIYGSELDGTRSQKTELVKWALTDEKAAADRTVMIGDRLYDINGAHANQVRAIGVLWGFGTREELTIAGADDLVNNHDELRVALRKAHHDSSSDI